MKNPTTYPRIPINSIVEVKGERYSVDQWHHKGVITYEFTYIGEKGLNNFEKSEIEVANALNKKIINIVKF